MVVCLRKPDESARAHKNWTPQELEYLSDHYGLVSDKALAAHLQRTETGIYLATKHRLHLKKTDNFCPARELARLLGVRCSKTIVYWVTHGWLKGKRAPYCQGAYQPWLFTKPDIIRFLKEHPWLFDIKRMPEHYLPIIQEEYQKDPWYSCQEAAPLLGVKTDDAVQRYINLKWLLADKKPGGPWQGVWIIRRSAIEAFLANDPRPQHKSQSIRKARQKLFLSKGSPVRSSITWLLQCPGCRKEIKIVAPGYMKSPLVKKTFMSLFVNGTCCHDDVCYLDGTKPAIPAPRKCPKCGSSNLYECEDGLQCFVCAKIIYS